MIKLTNISMAKRLTQISMVLLMLACFTVSSCGDDDEKKKKENQVKVDGKTFDFTKGYIVSEQITDEGVVLGSAHWVFLTGGDLEMEDNAILSGDGHFLAMYIGSDDDNDLVEDEYDMEYNDYDFGNVISFEVYENYGFEAEGETVNEVYDALYAGNDDGSVTVSKSDDKYIFEIDLGEYYFMGDSDEEAEDLIDESLKGYFSGELEAISMDEMPAKIAAKLRQSARPAVRFK